jgi:5-methyltetrahydrofolate--homocysteine methyltransferase
MTGLRLMNRLMDPAARDATFLATHWARRRSPGRRRRTRPCPSDGAQPKVRTDIPIPAAPYLDRKVRDVPHLAEVWSYINPYMLYGRHLGYKGNFEKRWRSTTQGARTVPQHGRGERRRRGFMKVKAVWQFFEAERDGNAIHLFAPGAAAPLHTFRFGRQRATDGLCLSDYILEPKTAAAITWHVRGDGRRGHPRAVRRVEKAASSSRRTPSRRWAIETAEGCAEWLHRRIREDWGFPDPPTMTMHERFTSRIAASATASAIRRAPTWTISRASGSCCGPKTSACTSPKA